LAWAREELCVDYLLIIFQVLFCRCDASNFFIAIHSSCFNVNDSRKWSAFVVVHSVVRKFTKKKPNRTQFPSKSLSRVFFLFWVNAQAQEAV
jgi:hypothetical protein